MVRRHFVANAVLVILCWPDTVSQATSHGDETRTGLGHQYRPSRSVLSVGSNSPAVGRNTQVVCSCGYWFLCRASRITRSGSSRKKKLRQVSLLRLARSTSTRYPEPTVDYRLRIVCLWLPASFETVFRGPCAIRFYGLTTEQYFECSSIINGDDNLNALECSPFSCVRRRHCGAPMSALEKA